MLISDVLEIHRRDHAENAHPQILGDPFLMNNNPVYRNIKSKALELGCIWTEAWPQYFALPFHELNKIVETKKIPYIASAKMLAELDSRRPHVLNLEDVEVPESYHLHESAHVIAEELFKNTELKNKEERLLKTILCESFANTVDALSCLHAVEDEMHLFFLQNNCYMKPDLEDMEALNRITERLGSKLCFILVLFAYVHSNFLQDSFSEETMRDLVRQYAPDVKFNEELMVDFETIRQMSEKLDPRFRFQTTALYLKLEGIEGDIMDVLNFPFMSVIKSNPSFQIVIDAMEKSI